MTPTTKYSASAVRLAVTHAFPITRLSPVPESLTRPGSSSRMSKFSHVRSFQSRKFSAVKRGRSSPERIKSIPPIARHFLSNMAAHSENSRTHHVVVALETFFVAVPPLDLPAGHTYELREYSRTRPEDVAERIRDADILLVTVVPVPAAALRAEASPRLKMIAVVASGTDNVDLAACRARGIVVANTPHCNAVSVAEHAVALYFAARRSVALSHTLVRAGAWAKDGPLQKTLYDPDGKMPRTSRDETLGIVGYGAVGKLLETTAKALGMKVLVSGRKGASTAPEGRTPFETLIRESSVIVLCLPRSPETLNMISETELNSMKPYAVIVNVSRGGIVDEKALVVALRTRRIAGYGTDVYETEPAGPENSLLVGPDTADLNLVTTPHVAWCAGDTIANYNRATKENIEGWLGAGQPKYPVA
ncbi:D-isomer specific 2-hydroxyacid dehydrogenase [Annulohypoxylon bovei var. microspora]|nr:D-isomer specific 2-hydroxyacid dehydrogenase [Annulohypoxylon bovei var. microspora]